MDYSFQRYLLSKQTVDDRALNKDVVNALRVHLPPGPVSVIEVGAGIGTMLKRLVEWDIFCHGEYLLVDALEQNLAYAREWIPQWADAVGLSVERIGQNQLRICDTTHDIRIRLECADVFHFIDKNQAPADLLIAHAFLDLFPMPDRLAEILSLTNRLAWLTINFDGISSLEPSVDPIVDETVERLYHATMDTRPTGGNSRMGRKLFEHLRSIPAEILSAGASDWVVHPRNGTYPADEKYFLHFILYFFETALKDCHELDTAAFQQWLGKRHEQVECGELVYIAHQMDFLITRNAAG